jgi:hypothetical protein
MMMIGIGVALLVLGAALGGSAAWLMLSRQLGTARQQTTEQMQLVIKLSHDVRGAVTPALLMTERLETNADPAVRLAAGVVAKAMDRAAELSKAAAAQARGIAPEPKRDV